MVLVLLGVVLWWLGTGPSAAPVADGPSQVRAPDGPGAVRPDTPALAEAPQDDTMLIEAAGGAHGLALRNRVCRLCADGRLDVEAACEQCGRIDQAGRVTLDMVGTDGRPIPDFDGMISTTCADRFGTQAGELDLPPGPCQLIPIRFDGAIAVRGAPVDIEVVAGEERYQLLEVPSEPHGGVGLMLSKTDAGLEISGLIAGTAALDEALEVGSLLVSIAGEPVDGLDTPDVLDRLVGPRGSEVVITVENPDGELVEVVLDRREILGQQLQGLQGQPG